MRLWKNTWNSCVNTNSKNSTTKWIDQPRASCLWQQCYCFSCVKDCSWTHNNANHTTWSRLIAWMFKRPEKSLLLGRALKAQYAFSFLLIRGILPVTMLIALCCVLHRYPSRGIHRYVLWEKKIFSHAYIAALNNNKQERGTATKAQRNVETISS